MNIISDILLKNGIRIHNDGICGRIDGQDCFYASISGEDAVKSWEILQSQFSDYYPVIMPADFNEGEIISPDMTEIKEDLIKYKHTDLEDWFTRRWNNYDFDNEDDDLEDYYEEIDESQPEPEEPFHTFMIPYEIGTDKPKKSIWIVAFPIRNFYEIPIYMQYGGWNACPYPTEHAAMMKYWNETYNAELIGITYDVIEMKVKKPPETYEDAMKLAKEQMAYCDDIVFQGTMTVRRLAQVLVSSTTWFFWWD